MLKWDDLLCSKRRRDLNCETAENSNPLSTGGSRTEIERDYDRILFAAPTRRLADKTQVFPLEPNDSIRTRLTHSHEVSNLARSIGTKLVYEHYDSVFGDTDKDMVVRDVPAMLAAVALAHDLGNPPFGHQGEVAMKQWFEEKCNANGECDRYKDFTVFDGNAQTFRLVTKLQVLTDDYGLNLTCGTLAALLKYPSLHDFSGYGGYKKFGVFESERQAVKQVWDATGLQQGVRHPLAYIMEACDDIAYSVLDTEDIVNKGYASYNDLISYLKNESDNDPVVKDLVENVEVKCQDFPRSNLSSDELNNLSMQMFRVRAIYVLVEETTKTFVENVSKMLDGTAESGGELLDMTTTCTLWKLLKSFSRKHGFNHTDILRLELEGNNLIKSTMDMLWEAISKEDRNTFEKFAFQRISENYRRIYEKSEKKLYNQYQLLADSVSGMTDSYLKQIHSELRPLYNGYRS